MFSTGEIRGLYRPYRGFAAARMDVRAFNVVEMPALLIEIVCCSMTSWIAVRSPSSILSNSSIQQMPLSASTRAPPSSTISSVTGSFMTAAVRPTPELPRPVVYTPRGATLVMYLSSWDFATPGSPIRQMLMSPRIRMPSPISLVTPPTSRRRSAFLTSKWPYISGAMDRARYSYICPLALYDSIRRIVRASTIRSW